MSRVYHWRISSKHNNIIKSGTFDNAKRHYRKVSHRSNRNYTNNARKMIDEPMKRYVHFVNTAQKKYF